MIDGRVAEIWFCVACSKVKGTYEEGDIDPELPGWLSGVNEFVDSINEDIWPWKKKA